MNKRIKKKKEKQMMTRAVRELVEITRRQEERRQAAIQRAADAFLKYCEQVWARQGI